MRPLKKLLIILATLAVLLTVTALLVFRLPTFGGTFEGARLWRMQASPQFKTEQFENTPPQRSKFEPLADLKDYSKGQIRKPTFEIPVAKPKLSEKPKPGLRAYWFGHASTLIEVDGVRIMTDPIFSEYASPIQGVGPKRMHPNPIELAEMPTVDAIVISHDHYDHLDMTTTQHFAARGTHFYVGLGVGAHLVRWEVPAQQIHEMDWWESAEIKGVRIHCTPARHYSGRKKMDNSTLWSSWLVRGPHHSFYYSGDTGYGPHFSETKARLGGVDLSVIKIGAYGNSWLDIHMDPESSVRAHLDLGAQVMLPVHWATFNLSYHAWEEPIVRALSAAEKSGARIITPVPGEEFTLGQTFKNKSWFLNLQTVPDLSQ